LLLPFGPTTVLQGASSDRFSHELKAAGAAPGGWHTERGQLRLVAGQLRAHLAIATVSAAFQAASEPWLPARRIGRCVPPRWAQCPEMRPTVLPANNALLFFRYRGTISRQRVSNVVVQRETPGRCTCLAPW